MKGNSLNMCECVCNCVHDAGPDSLCTDCRLKGSTYHYVSNGVTADTTYQKALEDGNRRFGSVCRHERVYFGCCSFCGRQVAAAVGGVA